MRALTLGMLGAGLMLAGCGETMEQKSATGGLGGAAAGAVVGGPVGAVVGGTAGATGGAAVDDAEKGGLSDDQGAFSLPERNDAGTGSSPNQNVIRPPRQRGLY
ncbi:MAG TPA: hypothetical protein VEB64_14410 [Azospirillaceae bacterium]|nr:hypothetical protein [Azospirillaceae bacterium]